MPMAASTMSQVHRAMALRIRPAMPRPLLRFFWDMPTMLRMIAVYLKQEFGGFAVHLLQK